MSTVYYLGAGASANSLPMIAELCDDFMNVADKINRSSDELSDDTGIKNFSAEKLKLLDDLTWLSTYSRKFETVDTFAKYLFLNPFKQEEYLRLKETLSAYFFIKQSYKEPDFRYDTFWISLLNLNEELKTEIPSDIKIISWNYDILPELTLVKYVSTLEDPRPLRILQSINSFSLFDNLSHVRNNFGDKLYICHLNGKAGTYKFKNSSAKQNFLLDFRTELSFEKLLGYALLQHKRSHDEKIYSELSFSWEGQHEGRKIDPRFLDSLKNVKNVVVIGYSFPFFNRNIDRHIFGLMPHLTNLYLQVKDSFEEVASRFTSIRSDMEPIEIKATNSFYFHPEL